MEAIMSETTDDSGGFVFAVPRRGRPPASVAADVFRHDVETHEDGSWIVVFHGRIDMASALAFRDACFSAIGSHPPSILFDLSRIQTLDSSGISHLVTVARVAGLAGVKVRFKMADAVESVFEDTGLSELLETRPLSGHEIARKLFER